ncbi:hypothetical protein GRF59_07175 [Paenibacillus sp. HJL G12]|uniref:Uncharacterized protein n=1 Tax=Paenibacillus dendrobii TaxID=2691084 RepID=A0A7X3IJY4_9BACL|nr:hypothetical protein [Paenibacillus dendrobii]MWV43412.1 hypothetical protein [Paenibacillus dendrobii]
MNPVLESLLGLKALNDQWITEDLRDNNLLRMKLLLDCFQASSEEQVMVDLMLQIRSTIELEQRLLELSLAKEWITGDPSAQFDRDMKQAYKAAHMFNKP